MLNYPIKSKLDVKIDGDYLIYKENKYKIPEWINKNTLNQGKTQEMILISYGVKL